ncbi:MAG: WHG domain-containing protein, partial [Anaerolineae bacterium]|nr:WHG domain-containing protein [Anaerolineae bacterium]
AFGVQPPSLYRHFASRAELLRAINLRTNEAVVEVLRAAALEAPDEAGEGVLALLRAYRAFAQANPMSITLAYSALTPETRPDPAQLEALALPLQAIMAQISGEANALAALRGAWALAHGFVMLELNGQFQRGGDLDAAFDQAVRAYIAGWMR